MVFDASAEYQFTGDATSDQDDVNKLYGFSDCGSAHTENSARFGWRWGATGLEILAFTHNNGKFLFKYMTTISTNQAYKARIELSSDRRRYIYTFDGVTTEMERGCSSGNAKGYHLFPYFGGNQVAPHDIFIKVNSKSELAPAIVHKLYPNPVTDGRFSLDFESYSDGFVYLKMYDVSGRLVWNSPQQKAIADQKMLLKFDLGSRFPSAIYLIRPVFVSPDGAELVIPVSAKLDDSIKILIVR